ncbi:MAG TPA: hypothetical protein VGO47_14025 [Chlamydiales bacterium]|jgi:hypothetical protein|nr:hypothetical protein [Chlamydiales bacterium]
MLTANELIKLQGPARTFLLERLSGYQNLPKGHGAKTNYSEATAQEFVKHFRLRADGEDKLQDVGIPFGNFKKVN